MWRLSQMDEFSFSSEDSVGVCVSENSPFNLKLTDYRIVPHALQLK